MNRACLELRPHVQALTLALGTRAQTEPELQRRMAELAITGQDPAAAAAQLMVGALACRGLERQLDPGANPERAWRPADMDRTLACLFDVAQALSGGSATLAEVECILERHCTEVDDLAGLYEGLLARDAGALRRRLGAFHTPGELARFVVHQVDLSLRENGLALGLMEDRSFEALGLCPPPGVAATEPVVVVLEPALGMGVFLRELLRYVTRPDAGAEPAAVAALLSRVRAFEVMPVASMLARLHLRCVLREVGQDPALADLATFRCADFLKAVVESDPLLGGVSVVLANPPYARSSSSKSAPLRAMMAPYREGLQGERNLQPLSDDYIKFVRAIELVLAHAPCASAGLVTNHSFLRGRLHRAMRRSLRDSFDRIDVLDLHGNSKVRRPGPRDENVFNIAQGVAVTICSRGLGRTGKLVTYRELRGRREEKLSCLREGRLPPREALAAAASALSPTEPLPSEYSRFVPLDALFGFHSVGGKPGDDTMLVGFEAQQLLDQLQAARRRLCSEGCCGTEAARRLQKRPMSRPFGEEAVISYAYRPFDERVAYYDPQIWTRPLKSLYARVDGRPILLTTRIVKDAAFAHVFVTRRFPDVIALSATSSVNCYAFPLNTMRPERLCEATGLQLTAEEAFAYVYAALHSDTYRSRYLGGLRDGFPRIPIMKDPMLIASLVARGGRLLALHLGEARPKLAGPRFVDGGDRRILCDVPQDPTRLSSCDSGLRLGLNPHSAFEALCESAWLFRVGGYQVCRKWLLDRRRAGRVLSDDDIAHYCDLVARVHETVLLQQDIDALINRFGGFPRAVLCG